jgi:methylase of polypeptide subunit release factors
MVSEKDMNKKTILKSIALCVCALFTVQSIVWATPRSVYSVRVSQEFGKVQERWFSERKSGALTEESQSFNPTIYIIEDAHESFEAQTNIAHLIREILPQINISDTIIGVEGAIGEIDISHLQNYPIREAREKASLSLVKDGYYAGVEHACISSDEVFDLYGLEDPELFRANYRAFLSAHNKRDEIKAKCSALGHDLDYLKEMYWSSELREFDAHFREYSKGTVTLPDYISFVLEKAHAKKVEYTSFLNIQIFQEIAILEARIPESEKENANYPLRTTQEQKIRLLDVYALLREVSLLSREYEHAVAQNEMEAALIDLIVELEMLSKLLTLQATPDDVAWVSECFEKERNYPVLLKYVSGELRSLWNSAWEMDEGVKKFYELAHARDSVMVDTLLGRMKDSGKVHGLIVAGGYHTRGIIKVLRERSMSYVCVRPAINDPSDKVGYYDRMMGRLIAPTTPLTSYIRESHLTGRLDALFGASGKDTIDHEFLGTWTKIVSADDEWQKRLRLVRPRVKDENVKQQIHAVLRVSDTLKGDSENVQAIVASEIKREAEERSIAAEMVETFFGDRRTYNLNMALHMRPLRHLCRFAELFYDLYKIEMRFDLRNTSDDILFSLPNGLHTYKKDDLDAFLHVFAPGRFFYREGYWTIRTDVLAVNHDKPLSVGISFYDKDGTLCDPPESINQFCTSFFANSFRTDIGNPIDFSFAYNDGTEWVDPFMIENVLATLGFDLAQDPGRAWFYVYCQNYGWPIDSKELARARADAHAKELYMLASKAIPKEEKLGPCTESESLRRVLENNELKQVLDRYVNDSAQKKQWFLMTLQQNLYEASRKTAVRFEDVSSFLHVLMSEKDEVLRVLRGYSGDLSLFYEVARAKKCLWLQDVKTALNMKKEEPSYFQISGVKVPYDSLTHIMFDTLKITVDETRNRKRGSSRVPVTLQDDRFFREMIMLVGPYEATLILHEGYPIGIEIDQLPMRHYFFDMSVLYSFDRGAERELDRKRFVERFLIGASQTGRKMTHIACSMRDIKAWGIDTLPFISDGVYTPTSVPTKMLVTVGRDSVKMTDVILDMGTGSGILGAALHKETGCRVVAVDNRQSALANAKMTARSLDIEDSVEVLESDLFSALDGRTFDKMFFFLPGGGSSHYIGKQGVSAVQNLDELYDRFLRESKKHLAPDGVIYLAVIEGNESLLKDADKYGLTYKTLQSFSRSDTNQAFSIITVRHADALPRASQPTLLLDASPLIILASYVFVVNPLITFSFVAALLVSVFAFPKFIRAVSQLDWNVLKDNAIRFLRNHFFAKAEKQSEYPVVKLSTRPSLDRDSLYLYGEALEGTTRVQKAIYAGEEYYAKRLNPEEHFKEEDVILPQIEHLRTLYSRGVQGIVYLEHVLRLDTGERVLLFDPLPDGKKLRDVVKDREITERDALMILRRVLDIMISMRDAGIHHWDVHEDNIWVAATGDIFLFDFDFAFSSREEFETRTLYELFSGRDDLFDKKEAYEVFNLIELLAFLLPQRSELSRSLRMLIQKHYETQELYTFNEFKAFLDELLVPGDIGGEDGFVFKAIWDKPLELAVVSKSDKGDFTVIGNRSHVERVLLSPLSRDKFSPVSTHGHDSAVVLDAMSKQIEGMLQVARTRILEDPLFREDDFDLDIRVQFGAHKSAQFYDAKGNQKARIDLNWYSFKNIDFLYLVLKHELMDIKLNDLYGEKINRASRELYTLLNINIKEFFKLAQSDLARAGFLMRTYETLAHQDIGLFKVYDAIYMRVKEAQEEKDESLRKRMLDIDIYDEYLATLIVMVRDEIVTHDVYDEVKKEYKEKRIRVYFREMQNLMHETLGSDIPRILPYHSRIFRAWHNAFEEILNMARSSREKAGTYTLLSEWKGRLPRVFQAFKAYHNQVAYYVDGEKIYIRVHYKENSYNSVAHMVFDLRDNPDLVLSERGRLFGLVWKDLIQSNPEIYQYAHDDEALRSGEWNRLIRMPLTKMLDTIYLPKGLSDAKEEERIKKEWIQEQKKNLTTMLNHPKVKDHFVSGSADTINLSRLTWLQIREALKKVPDEKKFYWTKKSGVTQKFNQEWFYPFAWTQSSLNRYLDHYYPKKFLGTLDLRTDTIAALAMWPVNRDAYLTQYLTAWMLPGSKQSSPSLYDNLKKVSLNDVVTALAKEKKYEARGARLSALGFLPLFQMNEGSLLDWSMILSSNFAIALGCAALVSMILFAGEWLHQKRSDNPRLIRDEDDNTYDERIDLPSRVNESQPNDDAFLPSDENEENLFISALYTQWAYFMHTEYGEERLRNAMLNADSQVCETLLNTTRAEAYAEAAFLVALSVISSNIDSKLSERALKTLQLARENLDTVWRDFIEPLEKYEKVRSESEDSSAVAHLLYASLSAFLGKTAQDTRAVLLDARQKLSENQESQVLTLMLSDEIVRDPIKYALIERFMNHMRSVGVRVESLRHTTPEVEYDLFLGIEGNVPDRIDLEKAFFFCANNPQFKYEIILFQHLFILLCAHEAGLSEGFAHFDLSSQLWLRREDAGGFALNSELHAHFSQAIEDFYNTRSIRTAA